MSKIKLDAVYSALLTEGEEAATKMMREYVRTTCLDINNRIINEDDLSFDAVSTDAPEEDAGSAAGSSAFLTVAYADPEGDCSSDSAIISALGREDMDGAGWADGIRTLSFQFDSAEAAQAAADDLSASSDESLPTGIDTIVDTFDVDASNDVSSEDDSVEENFDNTDGIDSPLSDTQPEGEHALEEDGDDDVDVDINADVDPSDTSDEDECPILDRMDDLTAEIEELKTQIAAQLNLDDDSDLDESFNFEKVNAKTATTDGVEAGGKKVKTNDVSLIPGNNDMDHRADAAAPIEIRDPNPAHGYAREPAPPVKTLDLGKNVRKTAEQDMSKVSDKGDTSALINKPFPEENDKSIIPGKDD